MELARKACDESKYRITNVFSGYLKVAVKNLSHILNEPEETGKNFDEFTSVCMFLRSLICTVVSVL